MKLKYIFIIFLLFTISFYAQEQSENKTIDSLLVVLSNLKIDTAKISTLNKISRTLKDIDPQKGIDYANKALKLSKSIQWKDGIANSFLNIGINNYSLGEIDNANKYYNLVLKTTNNEETIGETYKYISANLIAKADYKLAAKFAFKSLKVFEKTKNKTGISDLYNVLGAIYFYTEQTNKSIFYFKKALEINTSLNRKDAICKNLNGIGSNYDFLYKHSMALTYYLKALKIAQETNNQILIATINFSIADQFVDLNQPEKAIPYCINAKNIAIKTQNSRLICSSKLLEAKAYLSIYSKNKDNKSLLEKALPLTQDVIKITKNTDNIVVLSEAYKTVSEIYSFQNKHKDAKETYILYTKFQDTIYSEDNKESIQNLEDQRIIDNKNSEIKINNIALQAKEKQKWFFISGLFLLTIIGGLLLYQSSNRRKINKKLQILNTNLDLKNTELDQANKAKTRFFSILNHDLRGPVANLVFFLQLQKESPEMLDEQSIKRMQDKTMTGAENLLSSMEDILQWSKSQMENFKPQPQKIFVSSLFEDIKNHFDSEESVIISFENPNNIEINTDENYLKTIIRNLTGNSIKALITIDNPTIAWKTWQENTEDKENKKTFLSITDNGKGANEEEFKALYDENEVVGIKSGLGLHLIRDLAKAIDCEVSVASKINEGTTIVLKL